MSEIIYIPATNYSMAALEAKYRADSGVPRHLLVDDADFWEWCVAFGYYRRGFREDTKTDTK